MSMQSAEREYAVENPYAAVFAEEEVRGAFIRRTYAHLSGAVAAFVAIEAMMLTLVPNATMERLINTMVGTPMSWLAVLGAFMVVSWIARSWAMGSQSVGLQYAGLGLFVVAEAAIFLPVMYIAMRFYPQAPAVAGLITGVTFAGLTAFVFATRVDLKWMGTWLFLAGMVAIGTIVAGALMGFSLGIAFSGVMVGLAAGYILYDTSNILHHYRPEQHVAASLALFASVALLFWYVLQLVMAFSRD